MQSLRVAALQNNPEFGKIRENLHDLIGLLPPEIDLAVLPELCATGYQFLNRNEVEQYAECAAPDQDPGPITQRLTQVAEASGTTLVFGLAEKNGDKVFNSSVLVRPDGTRDIYRKMHLFLDEKKLFDPGDLGFKTFQACGIKLGMMVCFDWIFPESARTLALNGAQLIAHPSNLVLPWCPEAMITRSLENRVFTVTANRIGREMRNGSPLEFIGLSQIISPRGERLDQLKQQETGAARATINLVETDKKITATNDLFADRRPDFYR